MLRLKTASRSYELDVGRVDPDELAAMRKVLRAMNRDRRIKLAGI